MPQDAIKVSESRPNLGPEKSYLRKYNTSLNKNGILSFYKKEMLKSGWKEDKESEEGVFIKGNDMFIVMVSDMPGRTTFIVSTSKIPTEKDILAMRKKNPDKLNFMPLYPGSEQVYLWDLDHGVFAQYETANDIKNVAFFYKSAMLNYGWRLTKETQEILKFSRASDETCEIKMGAVNFKTKDHQKTTISVTYYKNEKNKF